MPQNDASNVKDQVSGTVDAINGLLGLLRMAIPDTYDDSLVSEQVTIVGRRRKDSESAEIDTEGEMEVNPIEQIRADIALLRKQLGTVDMLQAQIAMLPGKDEIVSAVLAKIPKPDCSCGNETTAAQDATPPECLEGGPC